jgi:iron complex outermembrane receptor protein
VPSFPGYFQGEPYYDVANIQVLRGPQGTIVGQNATGGAVFVNTNDPIIGGGIHGYAQANYGNYNDFGFQGGINLPISDTLAVRVAGYAERRDSFYHTTSSAAGADYLFDDGKIGLLAGRFSILWKPTDNFSILSKTDVDYLDFGAYPATPYWQYLDNFPAGATGNPYKRDLFDNQANAPQRARDKFIRSILKVEYDFDNGTKLRSVSSIQNGNTLYQSDLDGYSSDYNSPLTGTIRNSAFFDTVTETQVSQEFNIISPDNRRFTYILGAFGLWNTYFFPAPFSNFTINSCYPLTTDAAPNACLYQLKGRNPERSLAAFGQVGFQITPNVKLELGGRYTASKTTNYVDVQQNGAPIRSSQSEEWDNFSYKASLGWKVSNEHYLYGFVATGFRPGGLNVPVGLGNPAPFNPETVTSFEAGWKATLLGGHLRTTVDGFYNRYHDFQVIIGYPIVPVFGIEVNVPNVTKIYGFEAEANLKFGGLSLDAGVNMLHSEIGTFYATDARVPALAPCNIDTGPASASCINLGGREQTYAPNATFNVGAQYDLKLGNGDTITPRVNFGHIAPQWATLFENPALGDRLGERNILNAQLAYTRGTLTLTAYATNLTDQHYVGALNSNLYFAGPPRQYGVKLFKAF